ncbi:hypothetical protein J6590_027056 [Homalodisca vitripennis]|nr:hypothetical protein J6590_027056 [Homalodisca vitripennis]
MAVTRPTTLIPSYPISVDDPRKEELLPLLFPITVHQFSTGCSQFKLSVCGIRSMTIRGTKNRVSLGQGLVRAV